MNNKKKCSNFIKKNQKGSTLIVVLVAVSFLTVVAAIILSISSANLRMKQIEYATKQNFYVDEIGLSDVYNGIGKDVSRALSRAYAKTLIDASSDGMYPTQRAAYQAFSGSFYAELKTLYPSPYDAPNDDILNKLKSYVVARSAANEQIEVVSYQGISIVPDTEMQAELWQFIFKGVQVKYEEADHYESVITTDIVVEVPYIDFFQNFNQILDYSLIGNKGITFQGVSGNIASANIEGNVYAGIDSASANAMVNGYFYDTATYDGMNFYKANVTFENSNYMISKGDFNICESDVTIRSKTSNVTKEAQSNLWVENIRTVENGKAYAPIDTSSISPSTLSATVNIYAADDLELSARNSKVSLSGNYYGYNYNASGSAVFTSYETQEKKALLGKYSSGGGTMPASHTTSSAIIVNGNRSTLDLSDLNTLMVAGVAYIDIKSPEKTFAALNEGEASEFRTGESVAMRYNQFMYLAPSEILNEVSNPQKNGTTDAASVCPASTAEAPNLKLQD